MDMMTHTMLGIDRILNGSSKGSQQPMPGSPALVEGPSPTADARTAGVGIPYPVTCRARYYDAASRVLEDELNLFSHDNANELGQVIEQWIAKKRENWEPR